MNSLSRYYSEAHIDEVTGKLHLSSGDGTNESEISLVLGSDLSTSMRSPEIFEDVDLPPVNAVDGSYCFIGDDAYYRIDGKWKLIYRKTGNDVFKIDLFDENTNYAKDSLVAYMDKKFYSTMETIGGSPLYAEFDYTFSETSPFEHDLSNVVGLDVDGNTKYITTLSGVYSVSEDESILMVADGSTDTVFVSGNSILRRSASGGILLELNGDKYIYNVDATCFCMSDNNVFIAVAGEDSIRAYNRFVDTPYTTLQYSINDDKKSMFSNHEFLFIYEHGTKQLTRFDLNSSNTSSYILPSGIDNMAISDEGTIIYKHDYSSNISKTETEIRSWREITVDDMFSKDACPSTLRSIYSYLNIVEDSKSFYSDKHTGVAGSFCFISNSSMVVASNDYTGRISIVDTSNGVFNDTVSGISTNINSVVSGVTYFGGEIIVSSGLILHVLDSKTLSHVRSIDVSSKIEDYEILSMSSSGDTLYLLTTNGKIYKLSGVDSPVSGIVSLSEFSSRSKICTLDSSRVYVTNVNDSSSYVWEQSLSDGSLIQKTALDCRLDPSMSLLYNELYFLDSLGHRTLTRYRKQEIKVEG